MLHNRENKYIRRLGKAFVDGRFRVFAENPLICLCKLGKWSRVSKMRKTGRIDKSGGSSDTDEL